MVTDSNASNASNASNENNVINATNVYEALLYETVHNYPNSVPFGFKLKYKLLHGVDIKLLDQQELIFRSLLEQSIRDIHARDEHKVLHNISTNAIPVSAARPVIAINERIQGWKVGSQNGR